MSTGYRLRMSHGRSPEFAAFRLLWLWQSGPISSAPSGFAERLILLFQAAVCGGGFGEFGTDFAEFDGAVRDAGVERGVGAAQSFERAGAGEQAFDARAQRVEIER